MLGKQRGFSLVGRLHRAWNYLASRSHSYFMSNRAFAVLQMSLACSGPSKRGMGTCIWDENEENVAVDCCSSESNWGFCVLE